MIRVLFLQQQPCIRSLKYAIGLRARRPDIRLGFACRGRTLSQWYGQGDEHFDRWWPLGDAPARQLAQAVAEFTPDLIHSHNLPDELSVMAQEVTDGRIPVIHDVHDLQSLRHTPYEDGFPEPEQDLLTLEKRAVQDSAALVTVSEELLDEIAARHRLPAHAVVFPNYVPRRVLPDRLPHKVVDGTMRLVYQGTLSTQEGAHYDLRDIFRRITGQGITLDIYPSRPVPAYRDLASRCPGLRCHERLTPDVLLRTLTRYHLGWAGFNTSVNRAHLDTVLPNKAFEYLGCGLPVLTLGHRALARLVREHGVGASLTTLENLREQLEALDLQALSHQVAATRFRFTVERNIGRILDLYEAVVS